MTKRFKSSPISHVVRIVLTIVVVLVVGIAVRPHLLPDEFGAEGYYRPGAVEEEAERPVRVAGNDSCLGCHKGITRLHADGVHKGLSCEYCHGAGADHALDGVIVGRSLICRGEDMRELCMRCHTRIVQAMPPQDLRQVALPAHFEDLKVGTGHQCDQCHHVHAPLKWVREARVMAGFPADERRLGKR